MKSSAILLSKNDNYGGNLLKRATMTVTSLIENHDEVIFVNWKSKSGEDVITNIKKNIPHYKKLKSIQVPKKLLDEKYPNISKYNIVESIGRNVGIRRSENDYIISTNVDIISTPLNLDELNSQVFYTVSRRDVEESLHLSFNDYEQLYNHLLQNKESFQPKPKINNADDKWSLIVCCGDYQIGHKSIWNKMRGFEESILFGCGIDTNIMKKSSSYSEIQILPHYIFHLNHTKNHILEDGEIVPSMSDQNKIIRDFTETTNSVDWGMVNEDLPTEII